MDAESKRIIDTYFGEPGLLPLPDPKTFDVDTIPVSFWQNVEKQILDYTAKTFIPGVFNRLFKLASNSRLMTADELLTVFIRPVNYPKCEIPNDSEYFIKRLVETYYDSSLKSFAARQFRSMKFRSFEKAYETNEFDSESLKIAKEFIEVIRSEPLAFTNLFLWLTEFLRSILNSKKFGNRADLEEKKQKDSFNQFKQNLLRKDYREYDAEASKKFFLENPAELEYPEVLMLDRVSIMIYSNDLMSFKPAVKDVIENNKISYETEIERLVFDKRQMEEDGFSDEEIESLMPADLEQRFSFMENRSILEGFKLQSKPSEYKDGSGHMLLWRTDGATYRFRHDPPGGAPISLAGFYNVQRIVYKMLVQKYPEIEKAYKNELLQETNFIPLGYEKHYLEFEQQVMNDLKEKTIEFYADLLIRKLGMKPFDVYEIEFTIAINQIEVCWNQPLPFDSFGHLHEVTKYFVENGFVETQLYAKTPLFISKFMSEIVPNQIRYGYKKYKKTKLNLRNEIILGNELKNPGIEAGETLSDMFFRNTEEAKKYTFAKLIFEQLRKTEGLDEENYKHGYLRFKSMKQGDQTWKKNLLQGLVRTSGIPEELQELDFFDIFVEQLHSCGYVTRKFFSQLSDRKYRTLVLEGTDSFERCGRGKYRPRIDSYLFRIVEEYKTMKSDLATVKDEKSLKGTYHADTGLLSAGLSNKNKSQKKPNGKQNKTKK